MLALPASAAEKPFQLAPYKDELFQYQTIIESADDGAYREVLYDRPRDLYARDEVRGEKVKPEYVSLDTDAVQGEYELPLGDGKVMKFAGVGKADGGAKIVTIFVHGLGVGRAAGVNDWIHGGNLNRIKNLMMRNDGAYLSASFSDFDKRGAAEMAALVSDQAARSPGAPIFLICSSAGGRICWRLISDAAIRALLGGVLFLDAAMNDGYIKAAARDPSLRVPIHISSSREDRVLGWKPQAAFFRKFRAAVPDYPIRYVLFSAGTHGLSLRMTDWRETINWMLGTRQSAIDSRQ